MTEKREVIDALYFLHNLAKKDKKYKTQTEQLKIVRDYIEKQQKEIEELSKYKRYYEIEQVVWDKNNFISKNKIREKIKELDKKQDGLCYNDLIILGKKTMCKELLEEN